MPTPYIFQLHFQILTKYSGINVGAQHICCLDFDLGQGVKFLFFPIFLGILLFFLFFLAISSYFSYFLAILLFLLIFPFCLFSNSLLFENIASV